MNDNFFPYLIEEMIFEIMNNDEIIVDDAVKLLADYYNCSTVEIDTYLRSVNSIYSGFNKVYIYINGIAIRKKTALKIYRKIMKKIINNALEIIDTNMNIDNQIDTLITTIEEWIERKEVNG